MSDSFLAFVLLEDPVTPNMVAVVEALRTRHPELAAEVVTDISPAGARQNPASSPLIRCGDQLVVVMSMPAPIPQNAGLWSRAATAWPDGKAVAARHRGHLIVSVLGNTKQPLPLARVMTAIIGALIEATPKCCAVVWGGNVARPARLWLEMSGRAFAPFPDYPFTLWVDILPFRSDSKVGAVTMGLSAFAGREIEFDSGKLAFATMIEKVAGLASYLIEHGGVVKDGDTFGGDERERFRVRYKTSERFAGLPVFFCTEPLAS
jgi:hypothetical protein